MARIYSAAKATSLQRGKSKQEVWKEFIRMFTEFGSKTYIYGKYPFHEKVKTGYEDRISAGDVFKATTVNRTDIYVTINSWSPYEYFSYDEQMSSENEPKLSSPDTTSFSFIDHPEGTIVEIIRKERTEMKLSFFQILRSFIALFNDQKSWASGRLGHILGGTYSKLKNGKSTQIHGWTIARNDSLIKDY